MDRGIDIELRNRAHLVTQRHFLAIAKAAGRSGERRHFFGTGEQADEVGHDTRLADARPCGLGYESWNDSVHRLGAQALRRVLGAVRIVGCTHRSLVGQDEYVAHAAELLRHRRDEVVADQDVLVLFLDQLKTRWDDHLDNVLAGWQHRYTRVQIRSGDWVGRANRAIRSVGLAGRRIRRGHARELVHAVVGCRLELIPVVHAVIALELRVIRQRSRGRPAMLGVVKVKVFRLVVQREEEQIGERGPPWRFRIPTLARAVHVRDRIPAGIRMEALRPIVETAGLRMVHQRQCWGYSVGRDPLLIQVDRDMRNQGFPLRLHQHLRVVERARRSVDDVALDAAILTGNIGLLAELEEIVLAREALPALDATYPWRINAARGELRTAGRRTIGGGAHAGRIAGRSLNRLAGAVRTGAIDGARQAQIGRQRDLLGGIGQVLANNRGSARRVAGAWCGAAAGRQCLVGRSADVVDYVGAGVFVTGHVRFNGVPAKQREGLVEIRGTSEIRDEQVLKAAVAQPDRDVRKRYARLGGLGESILVVVDEGPRVEVGLPLG